MRSAIFTAPFVAAAYATTTSTESYTLVSEISGSVTVVSTYYYSNPATKYLTETNSVGVVTGMPGQSAVVTTQPTLVTSQPSVATIPAGLPSGYDTITYNGTAGITSFTVKVGSTTTQLVGGGSVKTTLGSSFTSAGQSGTAGGNGPHHTAATAVGNQGSKTGSAAASSSTGAGNSVKMGSAGMIGLGIFAALF